MKILREYCHQQGRYQDSKGKCIIELEENDDVKSIIQEYTVKREWYQRRYSSPIQVSKFIDKNGDEFSGKLLIFDTFQEYLD